MDYNKIYSQIVSRGQDRHIKDKMGVYETHHIIPRSCGGDNSPNNITTLTMREHYICHKLLVKIYNDNPVFRKKMIYALWWMSKTRAIGNIVTSRDYETARSLFSENNPNKCNERKKRFKENHANGLYKYDYATVSNSLKKYLNDLSTEDMKNRMENSALKCDREKKIQSIKKAKGSQIRLTTPSGEVIDFWSYDDVKELTGYEYAHIRYKLLRENNTVAVLSDGSTIKYLHRYTGNDSRQKSRNFSHNTRT
jgi:hypothetical protein